MDSIVRYPGKKVYIGMDVHKKTYAITAICEGVIVKKASMVARPEQLRKFLSTYFSGAEIICGYEAGFCGFYLQRLISSWSYACLVINPGSIEVASRDRVKTDKRDSKKIAEHLSHARVKSIRIPTEEEEERRMVSRSREQLVDQRSKVGVQIKSKLHQLGLLDPEDKRVTNKKIITEIEELKVTRSVEFVLREFCCLWRNLDKQIDAFDKKLSEQANLDTRLESVYRSAPGVGPVSSRVLANELGDMSQFRNEDALFSFVGLTPTESSSGDAIRKGHISHQGNPRVRCVLVEAAWRAILQDRSLREDYDRISARSGAKIAIVAVARRMIGRMRACFRKSELWKIDFGLQGDTGL